MSDAVKRVEASWAKLMDALTGLPEERMDEPGVAGDWSVKDVLGHVAYWEGRAIGAVERALNGEPEPDDSGESVDTINDGVTLPPRQHGWKIGSFRSGFRPGRAEH